MKTYRIPVLITAPDEDAAKNAEQDMGACVRVIELASNARVTATCGPMKEVEMVQLVGIKDGREHDLGDVPITPAMKARDIAREYGNLEDEDSEGSQILYCMEQLLNWMKENEQ